LYAYITGTIVEKNNEGIIIENNGIGYNIFMPKSKIDIIPDEGMEARIFTYTLVREDAFLLYGFAKREELNIFKKLISVSGIGPNGALSILSTLTVEELVIALANRDAAAISKAPGVGKKSAERLVIDLNDKVSKEEIEVSIDGVDKPSDDMTSAMNEAIEAMLALGFSAKISKEAVEDAAKRANNDTSSILREALKYIDN
jgi:Holliday junction DNA helicase RuvA